MHLNKENIRNRHRSEISNWNPIGNHFHFFTDSPNAWEHFGHILNSTVLVTLSLCTLNGRAMFTGPAPSWNQKGTCKCVYPLALCMNCTYRESSFHSFSKCREITFLLTVTCPFVGHVWWTVNEMTNEIWLLFYIQRVVMQNCVCGCIL